MITLLAQLPDPSSAQSVGWISLALVCLIIGANQAITFFGHLREKPVPSDTYATKAEVAELKLRMSTMESRVEENFRELDRKRSVSIAGLHAAIDAKTGALREELKQEHRGVHNRLTDVIEKIGELKGVVR